MGWDPWGSDRDLREVPTRPQAPRGRSSRRKVRSLRRRLYEPSGHDQSGRILDASLSRTRMTVEIRPDYKQQSDDRSALTSSLQQEDTSLTTIGLSFVKLRQGNPEGRRS